MQIQEVIKHNGTRYRYRDCGVMDGYIKDTLPDVPESVPWIRWKGAQMPFTEWQKILAFFKWAYDTHKAEALVHLYYNDTTHRWLVWAPPQRGIGMTVNTLESSHPGWRQVEGEEYTGFVKVGTGHSHNSSSAFQSGTDSADECNCNGLHFTIGFLDKVRYDLHVRCVFNGNMVASGIYDWVGLPEQYIAIAEQQPELERVLKDHFLLKAPSRDVEVPTQWTGNFTNTSSFSGGVVGYNGGGSSGGGGAVGSSPYYSGYHGSTYSGSRQPGIMKRWNDKISPGRWERSNDGGATWTEEPITITSRKHTSAMTSADECEMDLIALIESRKSGNVHGGSIIDKADILAAVRVMRSGETRGQWVGVNDILEIVSHYGQGPDFLIEFLKENEGLIPFGSTWGEYAQ